MSATSLRILCVLLLATPVWAAQIKEFVPQGRTPEIRSVQVEFDTDIVPFGDPQLPAPFQLSCSDQSVGGSGRWIDARRWTYVFERPLPAGVRCEALLDPQLRSLDGQAIEGEGRYSFATGGPLVQHTRPFGRSIAEDQIFVLAFNGPVDPTSVREHSHCQVQGLGEEVPVRLITGADRRAVLEALEHQDFEDTGATQLLQCARLLPAEADVSLVVGPGVSTLAQQGVSVPTVAAEVFDYTVRPAFTASVSCQRENARAHCLPITPLSLRFSAPIKLSDAQAIRLEFADDIKHPVIEQDALDDDSTLEWLRFEGPFPPGSKGVLRLPARLQDDAGRALANRTDFPKSIQIGDYPPLVKFASGEFGVIERFAHLAFGESEDDHPASIPLSVRHVEQPLLARDMQVSMGSVYDYPLREDREVLQWYARLQRLNAGYWTPAQLRALQVGQKVPYSDTDERIDVRSVSLLSDQANVRRLTLPGADDTQTHPFEVIGVPVTEPGVHVLEVESPRLGASLLADEQPMYVRTMALVTNLGVHLKVGRDDVLVWVTTLDDAQVVADAHIELLDCRGERLASGLTNKQGVWHHLGQLNAPDYCEETGLGGVFASARLDAAHPLARGHADYAFVLSSWDQGIEPWRFNIPIDRDPSPSVRTHTVLDRQLLRAGETVSMKHFVREALREGLAVPMHSLPSSVTIQHQGSDKSVSMPVQWYATPSGGLSAHNEFALPENTPLGRYEIFFSDDEHTWYERTQLQVEEFSLPFYTGALQSRYDAADASLIAPSTLGLDLQVAYVAGGAAAGIPVHVSAMAQRRAVRFASYSDFSFNPPEFLSTQARATPVFLNKKQLSLDGSGGTYLELDELPPVDVPQNWLFEAELTDPNGQIQTLAHSVPVWPASVVAGIRSPAWNAYGKSFKAQVLALDTEGQALAGVDARLLAVQHTVYSTRKRLVGGFYRYDNRRTSQELGELCTGTTDSNGLLNCTIRLEHAGEIELVAALTDNQGRTSYAARSVWVSGKGDSWFGGHDDDRIDLISAQAEWAPGELAEFQVQTPFQEATALITVEREGVLHTEVQSLSREEPIIQLPIKAEWAPNAYVSVLLIRGRMRPGLPNAQPLMAGLWNLEAWRYLSAWAQLLRGPGPTVDLAKPSFRFGVQAFSVVDQRHRLDVHVRPAQDRYQVRERVPVEIEVLLPDGRPAAHGSLAFAAVDQALLELSDNETWDVVRSMLGTRSYGVATATAQMHVVGRRHYGRKALPAGGGGGHLPTRELLDTLLLWEPEVVLDEYGRATIHVPLTDAITRYALVAIADYGSQAFGTGHASVSSTRDLYTIAGLPILVRQGDRYLALFTVRNMTERDMSVDVAITAENLNGGATPEFDGRHQLRLPAGASRAIRLPISMEMDTGLIEAQRLEWAVTAHEVVENGDHRAQDHLRITQDVLPLLSLSVQQSQLKTFKPDETMPLRLQASSNAATDKKGRVYGGVQIQAQPGPSLPLVGVQRWFQDNSFGGLEQEASRALGLYEPDSWARIMGTLDSYVDGDGLVRWFADGQDGDEILTAYLLTISEEAGALGLAFEIPDAQRRAMLQGLEAFVQGRVVRHRRAPRKDLDLRKLAALQALARFTKLEVQALDTLSSDLDSWSTSALIDYLELIQRLSSLTDQDERLDAVSQRLRARLITQGGSLVFAASSDNVSPWLLQTAASNQARLILASRKLPFWERHRPALMQGLLAMQRQGHWGSSVANVFGQLAVADFVSEQEFSKVDGTLLVQDDHERTIAKLAINSDDFDRSKRDSLIFEADRARKGHRGVMLDWAPSGSAKQRGGQEAHVIYQGQGEPWVSIQSLAAVGREQAVSSGLSVKREVVPLVQAAEGVWSVGDVARVYMHVDNQAPRQWVVVEDAIPAGARILGTGLGRDRTILASQESSRSESVVYPPRFIEQGAASWRAYFDYLPAGKTTLDYLVQLSVPGSYHLPPSRARALYESDIYAEWPIAKPWSIQAVDER